MTPTPETTDIPFYTPLVSQKNQLLSKWNLIFSKNDISAWISFKPQLGLHVYPCYACRDMFATRTTFQDHTNRRAIMIKYECRICDQTLTFYNRCSFLLHAKNHFSLFEGKIDLGLVEIFSLPFGMMGFLPHPGIARIFEEEEIRADENQYLNAQFYSPDSSEKGKQIVTLKPNDFLFFGTAVDSSMIRLTLKQISTNIPLCQFITVEEQKQLKQNISCIESSVVVKEEIPEIENSVDTVTAPVQNIIQMPVISKVESLNSSDSIYPSCPECKEIQRCPMKMHFTGKNLPFDEKFECVTCKYVASTECSFYAHVRIHTSSPPFICPECGKKFECSDNLLSHLDDVCFHLAKQVRIRCPGKKCGKLFASTTTFAAHFAQHLHLLVQCTACKECFSTILEFSAHAVVHSNLCFSDKIYKCYGISCRDERSLIREENVQQHIDFHTLDRSRRMYVFICKFCKNYFRSTITYATHLLKCQKMEALRKRKFSFSLEACVQCNNRIIFYKNENYSSCSKCRYLNSISEPRPIKPPEQNGKEIGTNTCILCKQNVADNEIRIHHSKCVYRNPKILVQKLNTPFVNNSNVNSESSNDSMAEAESSLPSIVETMNISSSTGTEDSDKLELKPVSPKSHDGLKRKRKKQSLVFRAKKPTTNVSPEKDIELQADQATPFDGTYYCKLCDFQQTHRGKFHDHIITHRDISTAYQCMECGECFVVKPSLIKHLLHYHKIEDTNTYLECNNCYDKGAVEELREIMKLAPGESRGPVKENQCRVCLQEFSEGQELRKHFRIHGMAFLMKNTRD